MKIRYSVASAVLLLVLVGASATEAIPNDAGCNLALSLQFSIQEKIQKCETAIHASTGARPEQRALGYYNRGLLYHLLRKYDLAIADYNRAMGWRRNFEDALVARGDAHQDVGEHEKAVSDYAQAATLRADGPGALTGRC